MSSEALNNAAQGLEPKIVNIAEELTCDLNEVEWNNRARELAEAHKDVLREDERKKTVTAGLNNDIKIAKARESKLADIVATRQEQREVTVAVKYDYELGVVTRTRTDTGEVISERKMTDQERQDELDLFQDANDVIEDIRAEETAAEEADDEELVEEDDLDDDGEDLGEGDLPDDSEEDEEAERDPFDELGDEDEGTDR